MTGSILRQILAVRISPNTIRLSAEPHTSRILRRQLIRILFRVFLKVAFSTKLFFDNPELARYGTFD